jgi:hypothetical protein
MIYETEISEYWFYYFCMGFTRSHSNGFLTRILYIDWDYKSPTCDVMYGRQRRHLYYGGQI